MDATIGDNPVVARSENKFLTSGNTEKSLPFPRSVNFLPATNAQLRSTSSSIPKLSHFRNPRGEVNHFRTQATKKGFLSGHSASRAVLGTEFCERNESLPVQWNNHLPSAANAALLSKQSSPLNAVFNATHSSPAGFPPSQSQLFSERAQNFKLPARDTWSVCKSSDCSNLCGPLHTYPLYLQRKVETGRLLLPTHCVECLRARNLTRVLMPQVAGAVHHEPAALCNAPGVARSLAAHPGNLQDPEACRLACLEAAAVDGAALNSDICGRISPLEACVSELLARSDQQAAHVDALTAANTELRRETLANQADITSLYDVVSSFEHSVRRNIEHADMMANRPLMEWAFPEQQLTGILFRIPDSPPTRIYSSPDFNSVTDRHFRGRCYILHEPRVDGW
jgi:hypothetical protein